MHLEHILSFCQGLKGTEETFPFGERTLVFKIKGKMYALIDIEQPDSINLKCSPEEAIELRERYASVQPGYHMNKKHWNTVLLNDELTAAQIEQMIVKSYELVISSLPKKAQHELSIG